jgi:hypothetical protein
MNTEKTEKKGFYQPSNKLLPLPSGPLRHSKRPVFRKFLVHASIAFTIFLLYNAHSTGCFHGLKKVWQYHEQEDSYNGYIKRIEQGYL